MLLQLRPGVTPAERRLLHKDGGRLISASLHVWRLSNATAQGLLRPLRQAHLLAEAEPDQPIESFAEPSARNTLAPQEWWLHNVGADAVQPPGPGVPLTVVDTGLDVTHPEFSNRPNLILLNPQKIEGPNDGHGTEVSSVAAAAGDGNGVVGVYPQAILQEWDMGAATLSDVIGGFDTAARHGRSVINISGGFSVYSPLLEQAVDRAFAAGSVIVAAVGNSRAEGSPLAYPASLPHVLTVAATDEQNRVASFSSRSRALDLAAPGVDIRVAIPTVYDPSGFTTASGTSFAAPIVAGAIA